MPQHNISASVTKEQQDAFDALAKVKDTVRGHYARDILLSALDCHKRGNDPLQSLMLQESETPPKLPGPPPAPIISPTTEQPQTSEAKTKGDYTDQLRMEKFITNASQAVENMLTQNAAVATFLLQECGNLSEKEIAAFVAKIFPDREWKQIKCFLSPK